MIIQEKPQTPNIKLKTLLDQIVLINQKYKEIAKLTGENFNVFKILNLSTNEVRTHSAFLGELLNSKGSHDLGNIFLKIFLATIIQHATNEDFILRLEKFDIESYTLIIEEFIGTIDETGTSGGRIDMTIKDNKQHAIILENKIYAQDQKNQLIRYKNQYKNAPILYLTLNGDAPSVYSCGELKENKDFICLSYKFHIIEWLELCKKEAVNNPIVRETLTQYIYLIKSLTHQTMNEQAEKEIVSRIMSSRETISAAFEISKNIENVKQSIIDYFINKLEIELGDKWIFKYPDDNFGKPEQELAIYRENWDHAIILVFDKKDYSDFQIGIYRRDDEKETNEILKNQVRLRLSDLHLGNQLNYDNWVWLSFFDKWQLTSWEGKYSGEIGMADIIISIENALQGIDI